MLGGLAGCAGGTNPSSNGSSSSSQQSKTSKQSSSAAKDISTFKMVSGPTHGVTFQMDNAAAGVVERNSNLTLNVVSGTSGESLANLVSGKSDLGFSTDVAGVKTRKRQGKYAKMTFNYDLYQVVTQSTLIEPILVHTDSKYHYWSDLDGAKIATGPAGSTYQTEYKKALDIAVGKGNYSIVTEGVSEIAQEFSANRVQAMGGPGIVSGLVPEFMQQAYSNNKVRLLGLKSETVKKIKNDPLLSLQTLSNDQFGDSIEAYQDQSKTTTVRVNYPRYSTNEVSADSLYKLLTVLYENRTALASASKGWKVFGDDSMWTLALNPEIPVHPGAVKFFKEHGMWNGNLTEGSF